MKHIIKRLTAFLLALLLTASLAGSCLAKSVSEIYDDVSPESWYAQAVLRLYANGIMTGTAPRSFSPQAPMTRGMFVTVLYKIADDQDFHADFDAAERVFLDTPEGAYYTEPALWAFCKGITAGTSEELFSPKQPITRQEAAVMVQRFLETTGLPLPECEECLGEFYTDADSVSAWAVWGVWVAYQMELMQGYPDGSFRPKATMTRAEAAVLLEKLYFMLPPGITPLPGCVCFSWYGGEINLFNGSGQALFHAEELGLEPMPYWDWGVVPDGENYLNIRDDGWLRAELQSAKWVSVHRRDFFAALYEQSGVESMTVQRDRQITLNGGQMCFRLDLPLYRSNQVNQIDQLYSELSGTGSGEIIVSLDEADRLHISGIDDGLRLVLDSLRELRLIDVRITGLPTDFWLRFERTGEGAPRLIVEDSEHHPIDDVVITDLSSEP